jgi:hypothetical protein
VIRNNFTSASIEFWRKHEAEKRAIQQSNLKKGLFMVVVFPVLFLILTFVFAKKAYAVDYNAIATAYVTTTISQNVVFDSTMQAGGTFTFSVLAHNGGGRAGQSDTANVKIQFYTSANALVSSVNSSYSANLPQPSQSGTNGLSGNPQADPAVPWSTLTISSTNCGGSCANVAYAKISMYGIDGSYWAGDYGPWYRAPTFTLNGGANMAYNPEFGPYNGITAQGWTSSPGFGACQGAWGGSNACIVNDQGQPGQSTAGLVANANGGGPSATGGTTSGQAGGYNSTMSTSNAGTGTGLAQTAPPPGTQTVTQTNILTFQTWDVEHYRSGGWAGTTGGSITTGWTWSCTNCGSTTSGTVDRVTRSSDGTVIFVYLLDSNGNMVISEPNGVYTYSGVPATPTVVSTTTANTTSSSSTTAHDFQGTQVTDVTYSNGTISGYDSIIYGTSDTTNTTTTTTPVTTTTYSDGSSTSTNGASTTSISTTTNYDVWRAYQIPKWSYTIPIVSGNSVYLNQSGTNPTVVIDQVGSRNVVAGIANRNASLTGINDVLIVRQAGNDNLTLAKVNGNNNWIQVPQGYHHNWANGAESPATGSNNNIAVIDVSGNSNNIFIPQEGLRNFSTTSIVGNNNTNTLVQYGNDNKSYNNINGHNNQLGNWQQGDNNLSSINLTGYGNQANVTQTGNSNASTITLVNAGGPSNVQVTQTNNGTGTGNLLSIQQQCATPSGCSVTINQTK